MSDFPEVVELNVGGVFYTTSLKTLTQEPESLLCQLFSKKEGLVKDAKGRYFIDRDGVLFRYVLDFLRDQTLLLPQAFRERDRLIREATYFRLAKMIEAIKPMVSRNTFFLLTENLQSACGAANFR